VPGAPLLEGRIQFHSLLGGGCAELAQAARDGPVRRRNIDVKEIGNLSVGVGLEEIQLNAFAFEIR